MNSFVFRAVSVGSVGGWVAGRREGDAFLSLLENIGDLPRSPSLGLSVGGGHAMFANAASGVDDHDVCELS